MPPTCETIQTERSVVEVYVVGLLKTPLLLSDGPLWVQFHFHFGLTILIIFMSEWIDAMGCEQIILEAMNECGY